MILAEITTDNKIQISEFKNPIADAVLFETIKFNFPHIWDGYLKTAVFKTQEKTVNILLSSENEMCMSDSECYIPHEVLSGEEFELTVFGVKGESIATAQKVVVRVLESGYALGDNPSEPTPSEYQQLINLTQSAVDIAQSVRDDADAGLFNGVSSADIVIDQEYNSNSENAQSGVAIAGALEKYLPVDSNTEWVFDGGNAESRVKMDFIVDDEISDTSHNPIANQAVKEYVDTNIDVLTKKYDNSIKIIAQENFDENIIVVVERVADLEEKTKADYITEQGTNGIWTYRKWASGIAECWGMAEFSVTPNNSWGDTHFYGIVSAVTFPNELFVNIPVLSISVSDEGGNFFVAKRNATAINTGPIYAVTLTKSDTAKNAKFSFFARGRWKEA